MDTTSFPNHHTFREGAARLADHARVLREFSKMISAARPAFLDEWNAVIERDAAPSAPRFDKTVLERATRALLDTLNDAEDPSLESYLPGVAAWSTELYGSGANFEEQVLLLESFRRALLPFVLKQYPAGPEAQLVFTALDALERAIFSMIAATGIESTHAQLLQGAHLRSVGRLTGGLMHALINTMAVIVGRAQILEEQVDDEAQRDELRSIQKSARTAADSLKRLQQYAAESSKQAPERIDVNLIILDVVQLTRYRWRDDAEASGIAIDVLTDLPNLPPVIGQSFLLRDALVELVLNSVEAMPLGGFIRIETRRVESRIQISVTDQGEGIDDNTQAHAAEPFFTTKGSGHIGLGLTSVTSMVHRLGGSFRLISKVGQGTSAIISLPAAQEIKQATDLRPARLARWANVLIVDDETQVLEVAARSLQLRGFRTVSADSGAEALRVFEAQGPFQVVLLDLGMRGMNGFDTARALKQVSPHTIIILMTGWASELAANKMRDAGIDRAITKPFDADQVIQLIGEALTIQENL